MVNGTGNSLIERPDPDIAKTQKADEPRAVKHAAALWRL
jgi:hypothetical protein